jgi:rhodanese-related sulfurtransferase
MRFVRIAAAFAAMAFAGAPALAQAPTSAQAQTAVKTVSSEEFVSSKDKATLVDVREPAEWAETGVPKGAAMISVSRPDFVEAVTAKVGGNKSKPVALICRSGNRSVKAAEALTAAGFTNVTNIGDGMLGRAFVGKGWLAANLPTSPAPKP